MSICISNIDRQMIQFCEKVDVQLKKCYSNLHHIVLSKVLVCSGKMNSKLFYCVRIILCHFEVVSDPILISILDHYFS